MTFCQILDEVVLIWWFVHISIQMERAIKISQFFFDNSSDVYELFSGFPNFNAVFERRE